MMWTLGDYGSLSDEDEPAPKRKAESAPRDEPPRKLAKKELPTFFEDDVRHSN